MTTLHHVDPATGEYRGARQAALDPRQTEIDGAPRYLIPRHATTLAPPPAEEGMARVWDGAAWAQVEDRRGVRYWTPAEGLATQRELGPLPADAVAVEGGDPDLIVVDGAWTPADAVTPAQRREGLSSSRVAFLMGLDAALQPEGDIVEHLVAVIDAADPVDLTAQEGRIAKLLLRNAAVFQRRDPDHPDLLERVGALLGLDAAAIDTLFLGPLDA